MEEIPDGPLLPQDDREITWFYIPELIVAIIADKIIDISDYIRFGAVCWPWRSIYIDNLCDRGHSQIPFLLLPTQHNHDHDSQLQTRSLYNLTQKKLMTRYLQLRVPHNKFVRGSSHGWLVILDENLEKISLLNPFLSADYDIELPLLTTLPHEERDIYNEGFLGKAVLSANPLSNPSYVVMVIYGPNARLAFFKPGDKTWNPLDPSKTVFEDVIYFKDQFYAINFHGYIYSCDITHSHPMLVEVAPGPAVHMFDDKKYLVVDLSGDLLKIVRIFSIDLSEIDWTARFEVFKHDWSTHNWVQVRSFGNQSLFLGDNTSIFFASSPGCKPNCIYFTDDHFEAYYNRQDCGPHDMGVFNIEDESFEEPFYPFINNKAVFPPPVWIEPTLQHLAN